jgi:hypothetical protein
MFGDRPTKTRPPAGLDLEPDAWSRFERAVDIVAKSPPQHRTTKKKVAPKKTKKAAKA